MLHRLVEQVLGLKEVLPVLATGLLSLATIHAQSQLITSAGIASEKVIQALLANPSFFVGTLVCTSATGLLALVAHKSVPPPEILSKGATKEEIERHDKQLHRRFCLNVGIVAVIGVVFVGGVYLVCQIRDGQIKLSQVSHLNELALKESEIKLTQIKNDFQLKFTKIQTELTNATDEIRKTFLDAANCGSPSFALVKNDTSDVLKVYSWHGYGIAGGSYATNSYEVHPNRFQVVAGNIHSWGLGQGMNVRIGDGPAKFLNHGEISLISEILKKPSA
jgi:hypothetical protein